MLIEKELEMLNLLKEKIEIIKHCLWPGKITNNT